MCPASVWSCCFCAAAAEACTADALARHLADRHPAHQLAEKIVQLMREVRRLRRAADLTSEDSAKETRVTPLDDGDDNDGDDAPVVNDDAECDDPRPPLKAKRGRGRPRGGGGGALARHRCDACGKTFSCRGNLNKHAVLHVREKPFACSRCPKKFNQKRDLTTHMMQQHTGERPHVCKICGKGFVHKFYLTEHLAYHTGDRRFQCSVCGKKFSSSSTLAKHAQRHQEEKRHSCQICEKSFVVAHDLKAHLKFVHNKDGVKETTVFKPGEKVIDDKGNLIAPDGYILANAEPVNVTTTGEYEDPKPALKAVKSASEASGKDLGDESRRQRDIEEWMISQGVKIDTLQ